MGKEIKNCIVTHLQSFAHWYLLAVLIIFLGIFAGFGCRYLFDADLLNSMDNFAQTIISQFPQISMNSREEMQYAFFVNMLFLLSLCLLGFSIIGMPFILALLFYKGYSWGLTVSFFLAEKKMEGIIMVLLTILPQTLFFLPIYILATVVAIVFSVSLLRGNWNNNRDLSGKIFVYLKSYLLLMLAVLAASCVQGYVVPFLVHCFFAVL